MGNFLRLSNGIGRSFAESSSIAIYDQVITIVSGTAANGNQVQGPVSSGTAVTLPLARTYTGFELELFLNGQALETVLDYNTVGVTPFSQVSFTFGLVVGDTLSFRIYRGP